MSWWLDNTQDEPHTRKAVQSKRDTDIEGGITNSKNWGNNTAKLETSVIGRRKATGARGILRQCRQLTFVDYFLKQYTLWFGGELLSCSCSLGSFYGLFIFKILSNGNCKIQDEVKFLHNRWYSYCSLFPNKFYALNLLELSLVEH